MRKKLILVVSVFVVLVGGLFLVGERDVAVFPTGEGGIPNAAALLQETLQLEVEAPPPDDGVIPKGNGPVDAPPQAPLPNPPKVVRAIYLTGWTAGSPGRVDALVEKMEANNWNGVVVDIKDFSGYVSYAMDISLVAESGAEDELRILTPNALIKKLHNKGIYVIGRITVFQDPILSVAHPEWAIKSVSSGDIWRDRKGLGWMDPASREVWDYNVAIASDALRRGFDEINFDYIRFPSDGNIADASYPFWDGVMPQHEVINDFFAYLRRRLGEATLSADLFGLVTVGVDDLGIGQIIEDAYEHFDYVSPMVYPSHYAAGFIGLASPAEHPYEVVRYSMEGALGRLVAGRREEVREQATSTSTSTNPTVTSTTTTMVETYPFRAKLRPWLQHFDLGAVYDQEKFDAQTRAVEEVLTGEQFTGWLLWDPSNRYER